MSDERLTEFVIFIACIATILLVVFLSSGCATDDPERMRVQAEGTKAMHDNAHFRAARLNRAQPVEESASR